MHTSQGGAPKTTGASHSARESTKTGDVLRATTDDGVRCGRGASFWMGTGAGALGACPGACQERRCSSDAAPMATYLLAPVEPDVATRLTTGCLVCPAAATFCQASLTDIGSIAAGCSACGCAAAARPPSPAPQGTTGGTMMVAQAHGTNALAFLATEGHVRTTAGCNTAMCRPMSLAEASGKTLKNGNLRAQDAGHQCIGSTSPHALHGRAHASKHFKIISVT